VLLATRLRVQLSGAPVEAEERYREHEQVGDPDVQPREVAYGGVRVDRDSGEDDGESHRKEPPGSGAGEDRAAHERLQKIADEGEDQSDGPDREQRVERVGGGFE
jgi:hypothetical protein